MTQSEFSALFTAYHSRLLGTIRRRWNDNQDDAEEIASRTFLRAWETRQAHDPCKSSPFTWLCLIARTEAHNLKRKSSRQSSQDIDYLADVPASLPPDTDTLPSILASLPDHLRPVAELLATGTAKGDIAKMLNCHRDTITVRCGELRQFAQSRQIIPATV